jgi:hypothetical protein
MMAYDPANPFPEYRDPFRTEEGWKSQAAADQAYAGAQGQYSEDAARMKAAGDLGFGRAYAMSPTYETQDYRSELATRLAPEEQRQQEFLSYLQQRMGGIGQGPSAAEMQMQQGIQQGLAAQQSAAASNRGLGFGAQQRATEQTSADMALQGIYQQAQLRAAEEAELERQRIQYAGMVDQLMGNLRKSAGRDELAGISLMMEQENQRVAAEQARVAADLQEAGITAGTQSTAGGTAGQVIGAGLKAGGDLIGAFV